MVRSILGVAVFLATSSLALAADDPIQQAIDRGVDHLKAIQKQDGAWPHQHIGATALAALTLLECGVAATDPAVQRAAEIMRQSALDLTHTYSLSLAVLFLDRLGDDRDVLLIESMTYRLLAGQNAAGGWTYDCPRPPEKEVSRLSSHLKQRTELVGRAELPKDKPGSRGQRMISKEIQDQLQQLKRRGPRQGIDDNSNTQFAVLALWVGRRQGMPVEEALARVDQRFRRSQYSDGGWGYTTVSIGSNSTMSMTCAGLLGLAVAQGARHSLRTDATTKAAPREPVRDPAVQAGLLALGTVVGQPRGDGKQLKGRLPVVSRIDHYFLWSLERVAVAYGLKTIGKKDWYAWGAEMLLTTQAEDGSWQAGDGGVNTCFALLFLRRANLAVDLSNALKGRFQDPGEVSLKMGGVGVDDLKKVALQPGHHPQQRPPADDRGDRLDSAHLADQLLNAKPEQLNQLLEEYTKGQGLAYTHALASVIPKLEGRPKAKARDALAERLTRMRAGTLGDKLRDEDAEVRAAAALACAMKEDTIHVPDLISLLEDPAPRVGKAAHVALKSLTGKDIAPRPMLWLAWWNQQPQK